MENVRVSILCNAFNHGEYIREALLGFVMQKTDFAFEVLVHDDASTDNTADIIREFEQKYPNLIKPVYQTENQYSKGVKVTATYQWPRIKGDYVAVCEGDDFWTDPDKLQKQFEALESHPECDMCAHAARRILAEEGRVLDFIAPARENTVLSVEEVIYGGGGFLATNSLFFRRTLVENLPEFRVFFGLDYTLQIQGALRGGIFYLAEEMSTYRYLCRGSWTAQQIYGDDAKKRAHYEKMQTMLEILDRETEGRFHKVISHRALHNEFRRFISLGNLKEALNARFREIRREYPFLWRVKLRLKAVCPALIGLSKKLGIKR